MGSCPGGRGRWLRSGSGCTARSRCTTGPWPRPGSRCCPSTRCREELNMILHVVEASWAGGSRLRLAFNDGRRKLVDLRPLLEGPVFEPLRDETFFSRVSLDPICGTVVWPNGAD